MRQGWVVALGVVLLGGICLPLFTGCCSASSKYDSHQAALRHMQTRVEQSEAELQGERDRNRQLAADTQALGGANKRLKGAYEALRTEYDKLGNQQQPARIAITRNVLPAVPAVPGAAPCAVPGAAPSAEEELWVIQRPAEPQQPQAGDDAPAGSGILKAKVGDKEVPVPLKHTDVKAAVTGYIATTDVTQQYHNPYDTKIEAVYVFPLPANAAVNEFVMTIGERKIRGIIREREEAKQIYEEAKSQGYVASLMTQERPNVFTQSVANIEPGKQIDINIRYFHTLAYMDGWYEYVFPMVVGPRFNPPGSTDGIGAVGRGDHGISGQSTEVQYLKPGERSGHDISLAVHIDAGVAIEKIDSRNHVIATKKVSPEQADVVLSNEDTIPNKDFVLRFKVAGDKVKSALLTQKTETGGYFTLMIYPPDDLAGLPRKGLEMVFTLDTSGSMNGQPVEQGKAAIRYALQHMNDDDTFQVVCFSNDAWKLADKPLPVNKANIERAMKFVNTQRGSGGTMMLEGIKASLDFPHDENRLRFVSFLTDGYIGNEVEILRAVHKFLGPSRVFSFGVGSSTNRYLLDSMAKMGSGAVAYLGLNDKADEVMELFFGRISHPALTDISIDWGLMQVTDVYPQRIPDLFVGRPVILTGRYTGQGPNVIKIRGKVGTSSREQMVLANLDGTEATHKGIPAVWARMKISDLCDRALYEEASQDLPSQIKHVALEYGLMSAYTSFVAVDSSARTAGDHGVTVPVPVHVPDGVKYETTVSE